MILREQLLEAAWKLETVRERDGFAPPPMIDCMGFELIDCNHAIFEATEEALDALDEHPSARC